MTEWDVEFGHEESSDGRPVLTISGEIDLAVAPALALELDQLVAQGNSAGIVDLSRVAFMDSSGVRELLKAKRSAEDRGTVLTLRAPSEACKHVLKVSGAWREFEVRESS